MQIQFHELIGVYLPLSVGALAQIVFLALPVDLKNWRDDFVNALTYIGVQLVVASALFVVIPQVYDLFRLGTKANSLVLTGVFVAALFRCVKTIPLEGTSATVSLLAPPAIINFREFYDKARLLELSSLSEQDPKDVRRIANIKERVRKRVTEGRNRSALPKLS
jgi:hypothetical protein